MNRNSHAIDDLDAVEVLFDGKLGRTFKNGNGGDHPPAIEVYRGGRYFAVTNKSIGPTDELRSVSLADLQWLIKEAGPRFVGEAKRGNGQDKSRSAAAWRAGAILKAQVASYEEMRDVLLKHDDPGVAEWARTKGLANDEREMRRIFDRPRSADESGEKPVITICGGDLDRISTRGEEALLASHVQLFQRANKLVRPVVSEVDAARGSRTKVAQLIPVEPPYLRDVLCRVVGWTKWNARAKNFVAIDPPSEIATTILARAGEWKFPPITGVISTPTMRPDGTILDREGYDEATGLLLGAPPEMLPIPDAPSRDDALAALALLKSLLDEFPFVSDLDKAVALSALITPVVRGAFPVAPMHCAKAPVAGSGKSYLFDVAGAVAIGQIMPVMAAGANEEELEKRLGAALLAGQPLICIDNVNGELKGDALCQTIERPLVEIRILGRSERVENRSARHHDILHRQQYHHRRGFVPARRHHNPRPQNEVTRDARIHEQPGRPGPCKSRPIRCRCPHDLPRLCRRRQAEQGEETGVIRGLVRHRAERTYLARRTRRCRFDGSRQNRRPGTRRAK